MSADESTIQVQAETQLATISAAAAPVSVAVAEAVAPAAESGVITEDPLPPEEPPADEPAMTQSSTPSGPAYEVHGGFQIGHYPDGHVELRCLHCGTTQTLEAV